MPELIIYQAVEKLLRRPSAVLRGARPLAYPIDMSRALRSVRLASDLPHDVFQQPAEAEGKGAGSRLYGQIQTRQRF